MKRSSMPSRKKPISRTKKKKRAPTASQLRKQATILWGRYIHQRDVFCQFCGRGGGKLDAHHIIPRERNATRADENNGVLVCAFPCHNTALHGDPFVAVQFYTRRLGVEGYAALRQKAYDGINQRFGVDFWKQEIERLNKLLAITERDDD